MAMTLLIVDDERNVRYALEKSFRSPELSVIAVGTAREGIQQVIEASPHAVILDIRLPDMSGLDAFREMRRYEPRLPVILITAHATAETAIEAMKHGAFEYFVKPYDLGELQKAVEKALEHSRLSRVPAVFEQTDRPEHEAEDVDRIIGRSPAMQEVYKEIGRVAPQDINVLILGESGTGKELVARAIYQHSQRHDRPFLAINCAAIPETLLESELFGHERGAFTGADRRRIGKFEQAHGGTMFLDEIGDMSPATQAKVLRLLQDGRFERVGGNETITSDVRILAATNRDLAQAIADKQFRQDLFYRLNTFTIRLPALRQRMEDLPSLVSYFVNRFSRQLNKPIRSVAPAVLDRLRSHSWPGNVRELQSVIKYAIVHATSDVLTPECLPETLGTTSAEPSPEHAASDPLESFRAFARELIASGETNLDELMHQVVDRIFYEEVLRHVGGHQAKAAELLGISRTTFRARLQQLNLAVEKAVRTEK